jgi:hypothetical protein
MPTADQARPTAQRTPRSISLASQPQTPRYIIPRASLIRQTVLPPEPIPTTFTMTWWSLLAIASTRTLPTVTTLLLLAPQSLAMVSPTHSQQSLERRSNGAMALQFQEVGDTGISAQMVSQSNAPKRPNQGNAGSSWVLSSTISECCRCFSRNPAKCTSSTRLKITRSTSRENTAPTQLGGPSMTQILTLVRDLRADRDSHMLSAPDRTMDVYSNTFCAGGAVMGNGTWVVFGGNQRTSTIRRVPPQC